jgi:hypothetical protein
MPQLLVTVNDQAMLPRVRMAIKTLRGVDSVVTPKTIDNKAKAEVKANIKEAFEQLKQYKEGKMTFRPAEALLDEL